MSQKHFTRLWCSQLVISESLNHYGSGITFWSYDPATNDRVYLLGSERWGRDALSYSDFGGSRDFLSESVIDTAAREASEETCGLFGSCMALKIKLWAQTDQFLKDTAQVFPILVKPSYDHKKCYVCLFVFVEYDSAEHLNQRLRRLHENSQSKVTREKVEVKWFSDTDLLNIQRDDLESGRKTLRPAYASHVHLFPRLFQ